MLSHLLSEFFKTLSGIFYFVNLAILVTSLIMFLKVCTEI